MAEAQGLFSIEDAVNSYLSESEQGVHKFFKCWQLAFEGAREMGLDIFYSIKSIKVPVNANKTVDLPADFLQYQKIGVENARGEVIALKYNEKLMSYGDLSADRQTKTEDPAMGSYYVPDSPVFYNYWNGYDYTQIFGIPSGAPFVGSFKIDRDNGIVLLDESFGYSYIILEYVASPEQGGDYKIPIQFYQALLAYISWGDIRNAVSNKKASMIAMRRHEYFAQRRTAMARYKPIRLNEAYNQAIEAQRKVVKG